MNKLFSAIQLAEYLNLKPVTIRRKAKKGQIPSIRIGNRLRFNKQQIDKWLIQTSIKRPVEILVIDDEPLICRLFKDSLRNHDYQVTAVLSSSEALELLGKRHYDMIFLDLFIPELDGAELFHRIRQVDNHVPVIIITGYPDSDLMRKALEHGPFMVMKKPFKSDNIINAVRGFVQGAVAGGMK